MAEASGFSLEIIRDYLISEGGKVEYHKLIKHFRHALADPKNQEARVLFKDLVNKVAVVSTESNGKFLSLRSDYHIDARPSSSSLQDCISDAQLVTHISINQAPPSNEADTALYNTSLQNLNSIPSPNQASSISGQSKPQMRAPSSSITDSTNAYISNPSSVYPMAFSLNNRYSANYNKENSDSLSNSRTLNGLNVQPLPIKNNSKNLHSQVLYQYPLLNSNQPPQNPIHRFNNFPPNAKPHSNTDRRSEHIQTQYVQYAAMPSAIPFAHLSQNQRVLGGVMPISQDIKLRQNTSVPDGPVRANQISMTDSFTRDAQRAFSPGNSLDTETQTKAANIKNDIRPHSSNINSIWSSSNGEDRPPKPPPRRKSFASSSNTYLNKREKLATVKDNESLPQSMPKQFTDKLKEIHELTFNSPGRVKEHAKKLNKMASESELKLPIPLVGQSGGGAGNGGNGNKDEADAIAGLSDQLKRRWMVKSSCCDYNEMLQMLRDCPRLAGFKDYTSTALHWAAKFNKPDIIKLIAGTHNISPNVRTNGGHTPLHLAAMFNHREIVELLIKGYGADEKIRDYSGRLPLEIMRQNTNNRRKEMNIIENGANAANRNSVSLLARTASLRQTHRQLLERLPSKYRTVK